MARPIESPLSTNLKEIIRPGLKLLRLLDFTYRFMDHLRRWKLAPDARLQMETLSDLSRPLLNELHDIYRPANQQLEDLLSIKLNGWTET